MPNYKIKKNETLSEIAKEKGTTVSKLMSLNPQIKDKNMIMSGTNLNLPYKVERMDLKIKQITDKKKNDKSFLQKFSDKAMKTIKSKQSPKTMPKTKKNPMMKK